MLYEAYRPAHFWNSSNNLLTSFSTDVHLHGCRRTSNVWGALNILPKFPIVLSENLPEWNGFLSSLGGCSPLTHILLRLCTCERTKRTIKPPEDCNTLFLLTGAYLSSLFLLQAHKKEFFQPNKCLIKRGWATPKVLIILSRGLSSPTPSTILWWRHACV